MTVTVFLILLSLLYSRGRAFTIRPNALRHDAILVGGRVLVPATVLESSSSTTTPLTDKQPSSSTITAAKDKLLAVCRRLKDENGVFLFEKHAKEDLVEAVEELENMSEPPGVDTYKDLLLGDWNLLCTTSTSQEGIDSSKIPSFLKEGPLQSIRNSIQKAANRYLVVQQRIRSEEEGDGGGEIDRVDHVIEYQPPEELQDVLDNLPEQLSTVNINPLHVSKSALVLVHKASIESEVPLRVKLGLKSIVLNVAGTSTFLDPDGKDLAGLNLPLGEFVNTGEFETTYMDDTLRISRGKQGFVDQLRVFVRNDQREKFVRNVAKDLRFDEEDTVDRPKVKGEQGDTTATTTATTEPEAKEESKTVSGVVEGVFDEIEKEVEDSIDDESDEEEEDDE